MQKLKIIFLLGYRCPYPGAAWRRISFFSQFFQKKGYETYVIGAYSIGSSNEIGLSVWKNLNIYNIVPDLQVKGGVILNFFLAPFIVPILIFKRPDIIFISMPPAWPIMGAYIAAKIIGARLVLDYRDEWEDYLISITKSRLIKRFLRILKKSITILYHKSDLITTVTSNLHHLLCMRGLRRVFLIPNGADTTVFKRYDKIESRRRIGLNSNQFAIVYSGGKYADYRLDVVAEAIDRLPKETNAILVVIGKFHGTRSSDAIARLREKKNIIHYELTEDAEKIARTLSAGDIGVIPLDDNPLWKNCLPVKFFEYSSCGLPVVATVYHDSLLARVISEYKIGQTCPPFDVEGLTEILKTTCTDREFLESAGERAQVMIKENFDREKISERLFELVKGLI